MRNLVKYYFYVLFCYSIEIVTFYFSLKYWSYDVIWLNLIVRLFFTSLFAVTVKKAIFSQSVTFYKTFFTLAALNPIFSSGALTVLVTIFLNVELLYLKLIGDLFTSLIFYIVLKKTS